MDENGPGRRARPTSHVVISQEALFRHHVVSEIRARMLGGDTRAVAIREVLSLPHQEQDRSRTLSERTLYRWLAAFKGAGHGGLEPEIRKTIADSMALPEDLLKFLKVVKGDTRERDTSVPELIRQARIKGVIEEDAAVSRTSVWRACRRLDLPVTRRRKLAQTDMRRFAYPNRMLMVLADGKHFRAGVGRLQRVALIFLDDATRFALDAVVGTTESTEVFLAALYAAISRYGLMVTIFLDNGGGFISGDSRAVAARLGVYLIYGTAGYPEGHGKIERFNQTLLAQFLRSLDGAADVDPDPGALRLRLRHYLHEVYNHTPHEGLDLETPAARFARDQRPLTFPQDRAWLDACFVTTMKRRVTKDNTIPYEGEHYELPIGHAGENIDVHRQLLAPGTLSVRHAGRQVRLHPVDLVANAHARRARPRSPQPAAAAPSHTAASLTFDADYPPLVGSDGGYPEGDDRD